MSLVRTFARFRRDQSGVFAVMFALMAIPLIALAGAAVDYTMWMAARASAQEAVDAGVLAAAIMRSSSDSQVEEIAGGVVAQKLEQWPDVELTDAQYDADTRQVSATITGTIPTVFVSLVGVNTLPVAVTAEAQRAAEGNLELALVLDNTWSMSDDDGNGSTKIAALKRAANSLLTKLFQGASGNVRVGIVPYAEYVNVGVHNRSQPWMSVAADTSTTSTRTCETRTTRQTCTRGTPKTCTRVVDGVSETYDCTPSTCTTNEVPPYQYCTGGGTTTTTWYGCVLSRTSGTLRQSDLQPETPYVGLMGTSRKCMTEVVPLTADETTLRTAINAMVVNVGSYRPLTYIPSGLVWGLNVVSPTVPFTQGLTYDTANKEPRKAIVLMTDGDNTLRFNANNGQHVAFSSNATTAATQKTATDNDTLAICTYAKQKHIEVFTVAFGAIATSSSTMLQSCATSVDHFFAATSEDELNEAFDNIAAQLSVVRLVR